MLSTRQNWALIALICGAIGISFASPLAKLAVTEAEIGWTASAMWRTAIAAPLLWVLTCFRPSQMSHVPLGRHAMWLVLPGVLFALDLWTWHLSFAWTSAAHATLLANLSVVLVGIVGWRFLKETLRPAYAIGVLLALGGAAWLLFATPDQGAFPRRLEGDGLALLTAVFYASYIVSVKLLRNRYSALQVIAMASTSAACVLLPLSFLSDDAILPSHASGWWWLILLAVIPQCLGQGLIVLSLSALPASFAAVTLLIQPLATAVWGWLLLGESLVATQIWAGIVVIAGIVMARLGSGR